MLKYVLGLLLLLLLPNLATAEEVRSVNFAVFQKVDKSFEYDDVVEGKFSDFIAAMQGSQILALVHTAGAIDGDVILLQTSVLRDEAGGLGDFGVDCQLSYKNESAGEDTSFLLGGLCKIIKVGRGQNLRETLLIPPTSIPDTAQGFEGWFMLDEDKSTGIAFYANVSVEH
ncbi:MAG: hypothetical protein Q9N02_04000 [Ghiorsea sp.]|nr:hypothetical protein [Ghiorsea sp.]